MEVNHIEYYHKLGFLKKNHYINLTTAQKNMAQKRRNPQKRTKK